MPDNVYACCARRADSVLPSARCFLFFCQASSSGPGSCQCAGVAIGEQEHARIASARHAGTRGSVGLSFPERIASRAQLRAGMVELINRLWMCV